MIVAFQQQHFVTQSKNNKIKINKTRKKQIKNKRNYEIENKQTKKRFKNRNKKKMFAIFCKINETRKRKYNVAIIKLNQN